MTPEVATPRAWRFFFGFGLTIVYLVGMLVILGFYYKSVDDDGRPSVVRYTYASAEAVRNGSMDDYICTCNYPGQIQGYVGNDTRAKNFNRCYEPEELKKELDVLQYAEDTQVNDIIQGITDKVTSSRTNSDGYSLDWTSIQLSYNLSSLDPSDSPLQELDQSMAALGYVGEEGTITVETLAKNSFFTLPQGFISGDVAYRCTSCDACNGTLWEPYNFADTFTWESDGTDADDKGWASCIPTDVDRDLDQCAGNCRFYRTRHIPWGIALQNFAFNELRPVILAPDETAITFHSRVLYANWSTLTPAFKYNLTSLETERTSTVWIALVNTYGEIPECGQNKALVCNGTSICELAPVYASNSETLEVVCKNYPTELHYAINRTECEGMIDKLDLKLRVFPDWTRDGVVSTLCDDFSCAEVDSRQIKWNYFTGERALNQLAWEPATLSAYVAGLCTNNYSDVYLNYNDAKRDHLQSIFETNCATGKSSGCWLTGNYKNFTDTKNETWRKHNFSAEEMKAGDEIFACWRFTSKTFSAWLFDIWGNVSGVIGSWLLMLSFFFWCVTRPHHPLVPNIKEVGLSRIVRES